jgi:hypothetical protein
VIVEGRGWTLQTPVIVVFDWHSLIEVQVIWYYNYKLLYYCTYILLAFPLHIQPSCIPTAHTTFLHSHLLAFFCIGKYSRKIENILAKLRPIDDNLQKKIYFARIFSNFRSFTETSEVCSGLSGTVRKDPKNVSGLPKRPEERLGSFRYGSEHILAKLENILAKLVKKSQNYLKNRKIKNILAK